MNNSFTGSVVVMLVVAAGMANLGGLYPTLHTLMQYLTKVM